VEDEKQCCSGVETVLERSKVIGNRKAWRSVTFDSPSVSRKPGTTIDAVSELVVRHPRLLLIAKGTDPNRFVSAEDLLGAATFLPLSLTFTRSSQPVPDLIWARNDLKK
jgi:hypothetical protein